MISSKLSINGEEYHNSPTSTLRLDVITELAGEANAISRINSIELVDSSGNVIATLSASVSRSGNIVVATASWTNNTGSSKTISVVRTKAGNKVYFETSVSYTVPNGSSINITVNITVSLSSTDSDFAGGVLNTEIAKKFTGETSLAVYPTGVDLLAYSSAEGQYVRVMQLSVSRSKDTTNYRVTITASGTASGAYSVDFIGLVISTVTPNVPDASGYGLGWNRRISIPSGSQISLTFTIQV